MMNASRPLPTDLTRLRLLRDGFVLPVADRCVQCGICSYGCPVGIDVRGHSFRQVPVRDPRCMCCGACVARCPRGAIEMALATEAA